MKNEEKRKDLMMEIERLKMIKFYEEQEKMKKDELKKGHEQIIVQIKERDNQRLRQREEQELEGYVMVKEIKKIQEEESEDVMVVYIKSEKKRKPEKNTGRNLYGKSESFVSERKESNDGEG